MISAPVVFLRPAPRRAAAGGSAAPVLSFPTTRFGGAAVGVPTVPVLSSRSP